MSRIRAGQGAVNLLHDAGWEERMVKEGPVREAFAIAFGD